MYLTPLSVLRAGYAGPLSPAPASLVPTLWARYFLRWQDQGRADLGPGQLAALDPVEGLATQFEVALLNNKKVRTTPAMLLMTKNGAEAILVSSSGVKG